MMKDKVYCNKCDHFHRGNYNACCSSPNNLVVTDFWDRQCRVYKDYPKNINKANNCPDFKKKRSLWDKIKGVK